MTHPEKRDNRQITASPYAKLQRLSFFNKKSMILPPLRSGNADIFIHSAIVTNHRHL